MILYKGEIIYPLQRKDGDRVMIVEERIERLEELVGQTQLMLQGLAMELRRDTKELKKEMKEFKDEIRKDTKEFKDEIRKDTKDFKSYTQANIEEIKQDSKKTRDEMNKKWGELANKWGTIVEDLVAPNIESIGEKYFNLKNCDTFFTNVKKRKPKEKEFDVIAVYDTKIILVEVKATPRTSYIENFIEFINNKEFYTFFPEYKDKAIIPVFASLYIPDTEITHLSRNNILAMALNNYIMDIINSDIIKYLDL